VAYDYGGDSDRGVVRMGAGDEAERIARADANHAGHTLLQRMVTTQTTFDRWSEVRSEDPT